MSFNPPKPTIPFLTALGSVATSWAALEHELNEAIWQFANVSRQAGACITAQLVGSGPRVRCLASLMDFRKTPVELIKEFNSMSSRIDSTGRRRNRYLHDPFYFNNETFKVVRFEITADRKPKFEPVATVVDELTEFSVEIDDLTKKFLELMRRVVDNTPAWPQKQFEQSPGIADILEAIDKPAPK